jgi:two-component system, NarL family, nitrate/nitrite response regulator NarL
MPQGQQAAVPAPQCGSSAPIRLILADSQAIYRVGTRKILALEDDLRVVAQTENLEQLLSALRKHPVDVVLLEAALSASPGQAVSEILKLAPSCKVVVLIEERNEEETVDFLRRGVRGIAPRSITPDLLVRCVRKVAEGETWLDNRGVNLVIEAYRAQAAQLTAQPSRVRLTPKELRIVALLTQGMKNKEIARQVGTSEQVVKNYLRKVYDKLGVSDRLELALYCIHHRILEGAGPLAAGPADAAPVPGAGSELET